MVTKNRVTRRAEVKKLKLRKDTVRDLQGGAKAEKVKGGVMKATVNFGDCRPV